MLSRRRRRPGVKRPDRSGCDDADLTTLDLDGAWAVFEVRVIVTAEEFQALSRQKRTPNESEALRTAIHAPCPYPAHSASSFTQDLRIFLASVTSRPNLAHWVVVRGTGHPSSIVLHLGRRNGLASYLERQRARDLLTIPGVAEVSA